MSLFRFRSRKSSLRLGPVLFEIDHSWRLRGVTVIAGAIGVFAWTMRAARGTAPDHNVGSIAVLPFKVLGPAGHGPHEGTGLADVLITRLSNLRKVKVRPTSAVQGFDNMGEDSMTFGKRLNVDAVLEGTIYRTNDKVRVTSRLIKVADGTTLWTGQFEKPRQDELRIHNEITAQVVETLASNVSANEKHALAKTFTENPEAYQLYLKGRFEWNKRSWSATTEAERMFRNAIEQDPNLALAYVGLADALMFNSKSTYPAMVAVQKALELDENLAEANATLGFLHLFHGWNWQEAENSFKRAIELNPNYGPAHHWYAQLLAIQGKNAEAKSEMQRALEINPLSHNYLSDLGQIYYFNREYREAEEYCRKALEIYPDFIFAHRCLYDIYLRTGDYERAVEAITLADRVNHSFANEPTAHQKNLEATVEGERKLYREVGIRRFLERRIGKLQDGNVSYEYAALYAFLGEKEEALASLESAFAGHGFLSVFIKADPVFDSLRDDPRYQAIVKNMGLSQF